MERFGSYFNLTSTYFRMSTTSRDSQEIPQPGSQVANSELLDEFRAHYRRYENLVRAATLNPTDSTVLERLGDELDVFIALVIEVCHILNIRYFAYKLNNWRQNANIFQAEELNTIRTSISIMQHDVRLQYQETLDLSHHGRPTIVQTVRTGRRGRPRVFIDPDFLRWAYSHRSTSGISHFLNLNRDTVRNALLDYGIAEPQSNPFETRSRSPEADNNAGFLVASSDSDVDDLLDPNHPLPANLPTNILTTEISAQVSDEDRSTLDPLNQTVVTSFTGPVSRLSDDQLDDLIARLRSHYQRAGLSMLDGMLRRIGHRVPRERIRASLMRVDPVQRVFQRIRIRRRVYSVAGPMALWHHDGQHG